jgi:hypothetical protein
MPSVFDNPQEEKEYLEQVKRELDAATTKQDVAEVWKRHYLKVGHRKLGRLLLGRDMESVMSGGRARRRGGGE